MKETLLQKKIEKWNDLNPSIGSSFGNTTTAYARSEQSYRNMNQYLHLIVHNHCNCEYCSIMTEFFQSRNAQLSHICTYMRENVCEYVSVCSPEHVGGTLMLHRPVALAFIKR